MKIELIAALSLFLMCGSPAQDSAPSTVNSNEKELVLLLNKKLSDAAAARDAGDWNKAITILEEATAIAPSRDLLWFKLGDAYRGAKRYQDAVDAYNKAIAIKPFGPYYNNLGEAESKLGIVQSAVQAYRDAIRVDPEKADQYYSNIGAVETNAGDLDAANEAYDNAIQANPNFALAYYFKGLNLLSDSKTVHGQAVIPSEALKALQIYLDLAPEGQHASMCQRFLTFAHTEVTTTYNRDTPQDEDQRQETQEFVPQGSIRGVWQFQPTYPELAREARIQGTVHLDAMIGKNGDVISLRVVSGNPFLVEAALNAVKKWRYKPYIVSSAPVEVRTGIVVNFSLTSDGHEKYPQR